MGTLVLVRHAKAESPPGVPDVDRSLSRRGVADARAGGNWLRETIGDLGVVLCSPARRAVQTAAELLTAYGAAAPPVHYRRGVYEASVSDLLDVIAEPEPSDKPVVLVGHNPSVSELASVLTREAVHLRTCGIAVVELHSDPIAEASALAGAESGADAVADVGAGARAGEGAAHRIQATLTAVVTPRAG